jgi:hypothetical protein
MFEFSLQIENPLRPPFKERREWGFVYSSLLDLFKQKEESRHVVVREQALSLAHSIL